MTLVLIRHILCMFGTSATVICIHWFKFNGIKFTFAVTYHSNHLAHIRLKGYS